MKSKTALFMALTFLLALASVSRVSHAEAIAVPNAFVFASGEGDYWYGSGEADAQGSYNITGEYYEGRGNWLPAGNYTVSASAKGYIQSAVEHVNVKDGLETQNVNLLLPVSGAVSGKVTDATSGQPLRNVSVAAFVPFLSGTLVLNSSDSYDFSASIRGELSGGDFYYLYQGGLGKFWANNLGQRGVQDLGNLGSTSLDAVQMPIGNYYQFGVQAVLDHTYVSLAQEGEEGCYIIFRATSLASNSSSVTIEYLYRSEQYIQSPSETTDGNGSYLINSDLVTGSYYVTVYGAAGYMSKNITGVAVAAGSVTNDVNVALNRSGIITGTVRDSVSLAPLEGILVSAQTVDGVYATDGFTDSTGKYTLNMDLKTEIYDISGSSLIGEYLQKTISGVAVTEGAQKTVDIFLDRSGVISGRITSTTTGQPLVDAYVWASFQEHYGDAVTNGTGHYRITVGLATGTYSVVAWYYFNSSQVIGINVVQGQETSNINLQIDANPSRLGNITGRVINSTGAPVPYVSVAAESSTSYVPSSTDANGSYVLVCIQPGIYEVSVFANGFAYANRSGVSVVPGQVTANINFQLQPSPSGRISGSVQALAAPIPEFHQELALVLICVCATMTVVTMKKARTRRDRAIKSNC